MSRRLHRLIDQPIQDLATHASPYVTVAVLAEHIQVERDTVVRMIRLGTLYAFKVGREWRIPIQAARDAFPTRRSVSRGTDIAHDSPQRH